MIEQNQKFLVENFYPQFGFNPILDQEKETTIA